MIKAIFFDLWSTLSEPGTAWKKGFELSGFKRIQEHWDLFDNEINKKSFVDEEALAKKMCELFGGTDINKVHKYLLKERGEFYPDVIPVLKELKKKYKLGLITNTNNIDVMNFDLRIFDATIISGEVGLIKPQKEIFELALKELEVKAEESLMVGDSPRNDIIGATNVGMKAILIDRNGYHKEMQSIKSLKELNKLLEEIE